MTIQDKIHTVIMDSSTDKMMNHFIGTNMVPYCFVLRYLSLLVILLPVHLKSTEKIIIPIVNLFTGPLNGLSNTITCASENY